MFQEQKIFSNLFSLRFHEKNFNIEYNKFTYLSLKKFNSFFSFVLTVISILILVFILFISNASKRLFSNLNINYEDLKNTNLTEKELNSIMLFYNKYVLFIKANNSNSNEMINLKDKDIKENIQYSDYNSFANNDNASEKEILENKTIIESNNYSIQNNNNFSKINKTIYITYNDSSYDYNYLKDCLRKILFSRYSLYLLIFYCLINIMSILFTFIFKKFYILKINFSIMQAFLGVNFHILSGILRSYFTLGTETLFFVISIQLLLQIFISMQVKINWRIILYSSIFRTLYEICLWNIFHFKINHILILYFIVGLMASLVSIVISYIKEKSSKTEFFWNSKTKFKDYLMNLLYNIDQGFLSFQKNKVIFMNKRMEKILKNNNISLYSNEIEWKEGNRDSDDNIDDEDFFEIEDQDNENQNKEFNINISNYNNADWKRNINNESHNKILESDLKFNEQTKETILNNLLDKLFENFTEVNEKLPDNIQKELKDFISKESVESTLRKNSKDENSKVCHNNSFKKQKHILNENENKSNNDHIIHNQSKTSCKNNLQIIPLLNNNENFDKINLSNEEKIKIENRDLKESNDMNLDINKNNKNKYDENIIGKKNIQNILNENLEKNFLMESKLNNYGVISNRKKFTLSNLYFILKANQQYIKKDSFSYIGKIKLKKKRNPKNDNKKNTKYNYIFHHQYELRARILKDKKDETMEIILNDVSVLIRKEREKAINQCRSMYLLKTAHEFMNPITSSMELINIMEEDIDSDTKLIEMNTNKHSNKIDYIISNGQNNENKINNFNTQIRRDQNNKKKEILSYLKNLYFIMYNFLKDFNYFCEIKIICKNCFIYETCKECKSESFCSTCNNCKKCNLKLLRDINIKQILEEILRIFSNIINFEGKSGIKIDLKYRVKQLFVKFNPEYINSIIFNIIYYFLKNGDTTGNIEICVDYLIPENIEKFNDNNNNKILKDEDLVKISKKPNFEKIIFDKKNYILNDEVEDPAEKIKISIKTNNMKYEDELVRFNKNKEILSNSEEYGNIEVNGFDEFNKSFQIYIGIILTNLSNSTLNLEKIKNGCEYNFECVLSYKNDRQDTFSHLNSLNDSALTSQKRKSIYQLDSNSNIEENIKSQIPMVRKKSKYSNLNENDTSLKLNKKNSLEIPSLGGLSNGNFQKEILSKTNSRKSEEITDIARNQENIKNRKSEQKNLNNIEQNNELINIKNDIYKNSKREKNTNEIIIISAKSEIYKTPDFHKKFDDKKSPQTCSPISLNSNTNFKKTIFSNNSKEILIPISQANSPENDTNIERRMEFLNNKEIPDFKKNSKSVDNSFYQIEDDYNKKDNKISEFFSYIKKWNFNECNSKNYRTKKMNNSEKIFTDSRNNNIFDNFNYRTHRSNNVYNTKINIQNCDKKNTSGLTINNFNTYRLNNNISLNSLENSVVNLNVICSPQNAKINKIINVNDSKSTIIMGDLYFHINYQNASNIELKRLEQSLDDSSHLIAQKTLLEEINFKETNLIDPKNKLSFEDLYNIQSNIRKQSNLSLNSPTIYQTNINREANLFFKKINVRKVLVIDDEFLIRSSIKRYFTKLNISQQKTDYTIYEAANVFEAFNIIYNMYLEKKYLDYIIIDEHMPYIKGSHMIYLFKLIAIEKNFYDIKFISYSAFNTKEIKEIIKSKGADYIINKPATYNQFCDLVNDLEEKLSKDY